MRDAFGEIDPDEVDVIDFIEPDASAFAASDESDPPNPRTGRYRDSRSRWIAPTAIASVVGLAAAGLFAWSPWRDDNTRSFPNGATPELTLTEELVFDIPPAELTTASLGTESEDNFGLSSLGDAEGYF